MIKLLEAINRGILRGLNEQNIELLSDLDDGNLDQTDLLQTKNINHKILTYKYFPKTKKELVQIIKSEVERKGWNCSLNHIDVSQITDMAFLFSGFSSDSLGYDLGKFNGDISRWNVSNVKTMRSMFAHARTFNQPIGDWNVSSVTNMEHMFSHAESFNQPISDWDVSNVKYMSTMFENAKSFNQPIGNWDVSNVTTMYNMFEYAESFNQPIGNWHVSNVVNMHCMFYGAESFNQPIGNWDVSNVTAMTYMFQNAYSFNQDLSNWKLNTNCNTDNMFYDCPIKEEYKPKGIKE